MVSELFVRFIVSMPHPVVKCVVGLREARRDGVVGKWSWSSLRIEESKNCFVGREVFPGPAELQVAARATLTEPFKEGSRNSS